MRRLLIVGATSAIAQAAARLFAAEGARLFLTGRDGARLDAIAADLTVRGADSVGTMVLDMNEIERHEALLDRATEAMGGLDSVLVAHGTLSDQEACERSVELTLHELSTNGTSVIALLTLVANRFEAQKQGTIAVISSVAGDRGRKSNYVYGAAKAAVTAFLSGLRGRLHGSGVAVVTIKPGPIATPMTAHLKRTPLFATAEKAGRDVHAAVSKGRDVAYVPFYWQPIMLLIKALPERVFKRLNLAS